ncbi:MAG TPA: hypothetical protein VFA18_12690, partial [Gemmataceae bacterium]|nr:hypothetical protein [Gemmataceae bacterium]
MRTLLAGLTSVVVLTLSLVACTGCPLTPGGPSGKKVGQVEIRGELGYYRHLDPVTGQGAVSLRAA